MNQNISIPSASSPRIASLDAYRNAKPTGAKMEVFRDKHGHLYPRVEEFEIVAGLEPGLTTDGHTFEPVGEITRRTGPVIGVPTYETDIEGNPLGYAVSGVEGGFEDDLNPTTKKARKKVRERNDRIDEGEHGEVLV